MLMNGLDGQMITARKRRIGAAPRATSGCGAAVGGAVECDLA